MLLFFSIWGVGTLIAVLFLDGVWQFLLFLGSAWAGIWIVASREDDGERWGAEAAKRNGEAP